MTALPGAMQDLNDLYFFAAVVEHGGFSAAGRALGVPKSRLSKRIAQLEERLGVRLLQRTTRRFVVTEVGERFYGHCRAVLEEAQAAQDAVEELRAEPRGVVRLSCPVSIAQTVLSHILPEFMQLYPKVQVRVLSSNRRAFRRIVAHSARSFASRRAACSKSSSYPFWTHSPARFSWSKSNRSLAGFTLANTGRPQYK